MTYAGSDFPAILFSAPRAQTPAELPATYAAYLALQALIYVPEHGGIYTANLTDAQLESTAIGLNAALTGRSILDDETTPATVYNRLAQVLRDVRLFQAGRIAYRAQVIADATPKSPGIADTHPTLGSGHTIPVPPPAPRPVAPQRQEVCF